MTKLTKIPNFATINKEENNMKKIFLSFLLVMAGISHTLAQGLDGNVEQRLKDFFTRYETSYANIGKCKLDRYEVNHDKKRLNVYASPSFGYQPFTPEKTEAIYRLLRQSLPGPVNYYDITIYADGKSIEDLIPNYLRKKQDKSRLWQRTDYKGEPWVKNISRPFTAGKGLEGRHIALWQSHGPFSLKNAASVPSRLGCNSYPRHGIVHENPTVWCNSPPTSCPPSAP